MRDLYTMTGVESNLSTAYHPQTDGQTERINQEVEQLPPHLRQREADGLVRLATIPHHSLYNDKTHSSMGYSRSTSTMECIPIKEPTHAPNTKPIRQRLCR